MTLASMTGFARVEDAADGLRWTWELRSVNAKGLDVRSRLPQGHEALEIDIKPLLGQVISRGSVTVTLTIVSEAGLAPVRFNEALLAQYAQAAVETHRRYGVALPTAGELLALRGVLDHQPELDAEAEALRQRRLLPALDRACQQLARSRQEEGARLAVVIARILASIGEQIVQAQDAAAAQPAQVRARLAATLADLLEGDERVDPDRLAQEVALLAARADVREELDRLNAHVAAAHDLLAASVPVGRQFDFLAQEFNREANTLCSKSTTPALTTAGLALKALIDQLREQVANIE